MSALARGRRAIAGGGERWLGHWIWVIPILLFVTGMSARQLDLVVPEVDEFYFMNDAGLVIEGPYSPLDVLQSVARNSPNHAPLYFILLNLWSHLVGHEIAILRVLTFFTGVLSLAMIYRLARDFVAPLAGLLALIVIVSNAFFNFYYANARMYPLLVLAGAVSLWLYLRLCQRDRAAKKSDYVALTGACYALANTHVFSALLFVALGAYHLLHQPKDQRWLRIALAVGAGLLLFSPWLGVLLTGGIERTFAFWQAEDADLGQVLAALHAVGFNGSLVLLLATAAGLMLGWRQRTINMTGPILISLYFLIAFSLVALLSDAFAISKVRFTLGGWPAFLLVVAGGLYGLIRWRRWLVVALLLFPLAGIEFQREADWAALFRGRELPFKQPAWHIVSRLAGQSALPAPILTYGVDLTSLHWPAYINYPQSKYYFADRGLELVTPADTSEFRIYVGQNAIIEPFLRVFYQPSTISDADAEALEPFMRGANYELCAAQEFGIDTVYLTFSWPLLNCQSASVMMASATDQIAYDFVGATVSAGGDQALFIDRWAALADFPAEEYSLSHQLISADWRNVAQLDLPLVHEGRLRQFSIDVGGAPAGKYELVAILYNNQTGERIDWNNSQSQPPYMLRLAQLEIPER